MEIFVLHSDKESYVLQTQEDTPEGCLLKERNLSSVYEDGATLKLKMKGSDKLEVIGCQTHHCPVKLTCPVYKPS